MKAGDVDGERAGGKRSAAAASAGPRGPMRLQKFLSRAGVASRRAGERLIREGRVRVDGRAVTQPGTRVTPGREAVEVDGRRVELQPPVWLALHKPPGYLCSRGDPRGRPTVYDLLPPGAARRLFHVGRLDFLSEGLLLLTNEGDVAHLLLHPSAETPRRYEVRLAEPLPTGLAERLLEGLPLEDGIARADAAVVLPGERAGEGLLLVTLHEGRNREIRRMMEHLGATIRSLRRVAFGPVELGELPPGAHRRLSEEEVRMLRSAAREGRAPRRKGGAR